MFSLLIHIRTKFHILSSNGFFFSNFYYMNTKYRFSPRCYFSFYKIIIASEFACFWKVYHLCNFRAFVLFPPTKHGERGFKEGGINRILCGRLRYVAGVGP